MLTLCWLASWIQEAGVVSIGTLAQRFALASELLLTVVTAHMGKSIQGRLEGGLIYTPAYVARVKAQVHILLRNIFFGFL